MKEEVNDEMAGLHKKLAEQMENIFFYGAPTWFEYKYGRKPTPEEQILLDKKYNAYKQIKEAIKELQTNPFSFDRNKEIITISDDDGCFIYAITPNKTHEMLKEYQQYLRDLINQAKQDLRDELGQEIY